tara:strand:+ start:9489 stop:9635 length:147 start_codon:yes stop_codon:yes gene_type:complete
VDLNLDYQITKIKNVSVINPIGRGVIENHRLITFMPAIAKYFLTGGLW